MLRAVPAPLPDVARIAVLRANAIGDFVFALPALAALRSAYPDAEIVLLGRAWHAEFLQGRGGPVDRVIALPSIACVTAAAEGPADEAKAQRCVDALRAERFDLALQWHGGGRFTNPFVRALGARTTAGLRAPDAPALDRNLAYLRWRNERLRLLEAAALVGAPPVSLVPALPLAAGDREEADRELPPSARRLAILQPGSTDPRRCWPAASFAALGDALVRDGLDVAVNGSSAERGVVDAVLRGMREPARAVFPTLRGLAGLLARASVVIGNDTGPLYLAEAFGTPTVGVYWCGNALVSGALAAQRHRAAIAWRLDCPVCGARNVEARCPHDASFVADVAVDEVRANVQDLIYSG